jgi:hypothetical protein
VRTRLASLLASAAALALAPAAAAQGTPLTLGGPAELADGGRLELAGAGAAPHEPISIEAFGRGGWAPVAGTQAGEDGRFRDAIRVRVAGPRRVLVRAVGVDGRASRALRVRVRRLVLAAVGDVNLGDGPGHVMAERGYRFPWGGVAPVLRRADVALANLECAVSTRGRPVPKEFRFRGRPAALRVAHDYAGIDAMSLANNHVGDYGTAALLDTVRHTRRFGMAAIGAGRDLADARASRVVERLGLRVAFVGFSDIGPASFAAGPNRPGTAFASDEAIRAGVRAARRRGDVVVAVFHWGVERARRENARQRHFAAVALGAGADAVIGHHPHVLQPVRRHGRRVVAYSLGNFVWSAGSAATARTGILELRLSARGVERSRMLPAIPRAPRPEFVGR